MHIVFTTLLIAIPLQVKKRSVKNVQNSSHKLFMILFYFYHVLKRNDIKFIPKKKKYLQYFFDYQFIPFLVIDNLIGIRLLYLNERIFEYRLCSLQGEGI